MPCVQLHELGVTISTASVGGCAASAAAKFVSPTCRLCSNRQVGLTNFAAALAAHPPTEAVEIVTPSSWSCTHGIERWRSACGCRIHHDVPSQQEWRAPLRAAIDWLAAEIHALYEREGRDLPGGFWAFRDAAGGSGAST